MGRAFLTEVQRAKARRCAGLRLKASSVPARPCARKIRRYADDRREALSETNKIQPAKPMNAKPSNAGIISPVICRPDNCVDADAEKHACVNPFRLSERPAGLTFFGNAPHL